LTARVRRLTARPLAEANGWLESYRRFWEGNFQRLDGVLEDPRLRDASYDKLEELVRSGERSAG